MGISHFVMQNCAKCGHHEVTLLSGMKWTWKYSQDMAPPETSLYVKYATGSDKLLVWWKRFRVADLQYWEKGLFVIFLYTLRWQQHDIYEHNTGNYAIYKIYSFPEWRSQYATTKLSLQLGKHVQKQSPKSDRCSWCLGVVIFCICTDIPWKWE